MSWLGPIQFIHAEYAGQSLSSKYGVGHHHDTATSYGFLTLALLRDS
jgi:hypothetical protein